MNTCTEHWEAIYRALYDRGLGKFICRSSEELERKQRTAKTDAERFDPITGSMRMLTATSIQLLGHEIDGCVVCTLENLRKSCNCVNCKAGWTWIDALAQDQWNEAVELKLVLPAV